MWYMWTALLLAVQAASADTASPAPATAATTAVPAPVATTTHAPLRTLDRKAAELVWRTWLQESGNQHGPPRRITTKSLFITPYNCPKGHRLDQQGCVQMVSVNQDEHERMLLDELNKLFTASPGNGEVIYDYGDELSGPVQVSIPIGLEPQASPLQAEPSGEAQNNIKVDKKDDNKTNADASLEAELELLKLQGNQNYPNDKATADQHTALNNNFLPYPDKPKRDSPIVDETEKLAVIKIPDQGQKEKVYGQVNVDPVLYNTEYNDQQTDLPTTTEALTEIPEESTSSPLNNGTTVNSTVTEDNNTTINNDSVNKTTTGSDTKVHILKKDQSKLNPENEYSDIGETIKLISRYADVTTDDNFSKDQKKVIQDDSILGTREKPQHRRRPLKAALIEPKNPQTERDVVETHNFYPKSNVYYRYPWSIENAPTPPPNYPFKNLQDYWPGQNRMGGVYNTAHENPTRHHHMYPQNYFRPRGYGNPHPGYHQYSGLSPQAYPGYPRHGLPRHASIIRPRSTDQDLYGLLGLRHWFSGEGTSKR